MSDIQIKLIRQFPNVSVVEDSTGDLKLIPARYAVGQKIGMTFDVPKDAMRTGIEYGIDWNLVFPKGLTIKPEEIKKSFFGQGIFTLEDLQKDPNKTLAAINSILKLAAVEIIRKAKATLGGD